MMRATIAMSFGSSAIIVPQQVVTHLGRFELQTYIINLAQQQTDAIHDVENYKANITE
jgi:hypothetical protein